MSAAVLAAVAAGGALGAVLRAAALRLGRSSHRLPYATLAVNIAGSLALGWTAGGGVEHPTLLAGLSVGALGGFTTYSTFAWETATLANGGKPVRAIAYVALTVIASIASAAAGSALAP